MNLFVPGEEDVRQTMPHLHQSTRRDLYSQMEVERVDNLAVRYQSETP